MGALISEEYRQLNAELHARRSDYGAQGHHWAEEVVRIARQNNCTTILDYGCGKGSLAKALEEEFEVTEYDPAIPGKDKPPAAVDLVVCTDVLEHVEPENLENVIKDIQRLSHKIFMFSICTRPAVKFLADGRNAHLSLHDAAWWRSSIAKWFDIAATSFKSPSFVGFARSRIKQIDRFNVISVTENDTRNDNTRTNIEVTSNRLQPHALHDKTAYLACFGPSLQKTWPQLAMDNARGNQVFTMSGSHQFLIDRNVIPYAHIDCDPRPYKAEQMGTPHSQVKYWVASCVHPPYVEKLKNFDLSLWHLWNGEGSSPILDEIEPGSWAVAGGACIGLRSIALLYSLGYRKFEIHGMDCSQDGDNSHAATHLGKYQPQMEIQCGDRWFKTTGALASYAQQFFTLRDLTKDAEYRLHGDGLLQHMVKLQ